MTFHNPSYSKHSISSLSSSSSPLPPIFAQDPVPLYNYKNLHPHENAFLKQHPTPYLHQSNYPPYFHYPHPHHQIDSTLLSTSTSNSYGYYNHHYNNHDHSYYYYNNNKTTHHPTLDPSKYPVIGGDGLNYHDHSGKPLNTVPTPSSVPLLYNPPPSSLPFHYTPAPSETPIHSQKTMDPITHNQSLEIDHPSSGSPNVLGACHVNHPSFFYGPYSNFGLAPHPPPPLPGFNSNHPSVNSTGPFHPRLHPHPSYSTHPGHMVYGPPQGGLGYMDTPRYSYPVTTSTYPMGLPDLRYPSQQSVGTQGSASLYPVPARFPDRIASHSSYPLPYQPKVTHSIDPVSRHVNGTHSTALSFPDKGPWISHGVDIPDLTIPNAYDTGHPVSVKKVDTTRSQNKDGKLPSTDVSPNKPMKKPRSSRRSNLVLDSDSDLNNNHGDEYVHGASDYQLDPDRDDLNTGMNCKKSKPTDRSAKGRRSNQTTRSLKTKTLLRSGQGHLPPVNPSIHPVPNQRVDVDLNGASASTTLPSGSPHNNLIPAEPIRSVHSFPPSDPTYTRIPARPVVSSAQVCTSRKRKYRRHPKTDLNEPQKPQSAYVVFANEVRAEVREMKLSFAELAKIVGDRWKCMPVDEKRNREKVAANAKQEYQHQLGLYRRSPQYQAYQMYLRDFEAVSNSPCPSSDALRVGSHSSSNSLTVGPPSVPDKQQVKKKVGKRQDSKGMHGGSCSDVHERDLPYTMLDSTPMYSGVHTLHTHGNACINQPADPDAMCAHPESPVTLGQTKIMVEPLTSLQVPTSQF